MFIHTSWFHRFQVTEQKGFENEEEDSNAQAWDNKQDRGSRWISKLDMCLTD